MVLDCRKPAASPKVMHLTQSQLEGKKEEFCVALHLRPIRYRLPIDGLPPTAFPQRPELPQKLPIPFDRGPCIPGQESWSVAVAPLGSITCAGRQC